jgi:wyosine [tRNA(Phe)-imidazoG37] synthetase (radical SAM superfamily)
MTNRKIKKAVKRLKHLPGGFNFFRYSFNKVQSKGLKMIKSVKVGHPSTLMLEVTNQCNLHCITCPREFNYGKEMDKGFMDYDHLKKIVDESIPYIDSIGLTGLGEPTLYKDLVPAIDYIRSKSKGISFHFLQTPACLPVSMFLNHVSIKLILYRFQLMALAMCTIRLG